MNTKYTRQRKIFNLYVYIQCLEIPSRVHDNTSILNKTGYLGCSHYQQSSSI
jgi:hypothetical protein